MNLKNLYELRDAFVGVKPELYHFKVLRKKLGKIGLCL